jgi:hypothetical protein
MHYFVKLIWCFFGEGGGELFPHKKISSTKNICGKKEKVSFPLGLNKVRSILFRLGQFCLGFLLPRYWKGPCFLVQCWWLAAWLPYLNNLHWPGTRLDLEPERTRRPNCHLVCSNSGLCTLKLKKIIFVSFTILFKTSFNTPIGII